MKLSFRRALFVLIASCAVLTAVYAAKPVATDDASENSYYVYTSALDVDEAGVVKVPSRYRWSVESSLRGIDVQGNAIPDSRVMLRLHDPDHNFTVLTAQMDLATAAKLHHQLGDMIVKKLNDPSYQYRPQLYRPDQIPTKQAIGVDDRGVLILEDVNDPAQSSTPPKR